MSESPARYVMGLPCKENLPGLADRNADSNSCGELAAVPHQFTDLESTLFRFSILWLLLATPQIYAQGALPDTRALTLPQAAERVLRQNPRLQSAQFAREAAATRSEDAALKP